MSKGSRPRPFSVSQEAFNAQMDTIFGKKPPREQYVPPPLPDVFEEKKTIQWQDDPSINTEQLQSDVKDSSQGG